MKVVCWDVGIKNLAYCIMENTDDSNRPYTIHKWDIINMAQDEDIVCCVEDCEKNKDIKFTCSQMGQDIYYCKTHKGLYEEHYQEWVTMKESLQPIAKQTTVKDDDRGENLAISCCMCESDAKWNVGEVYYCTKHKTSNLKKFEKEISLRKFSACKVKSIPVEKLKLTLFERLDAIPELLDVDDVCIENQPSFKNPRMKAIADSLYSWFLIRGKIDRIRSGLIPINKVVFLSPSNKLKIKGCEEEINAEIKQSSNKYKTVKNLSIKHCKEILKYEPEYIRHLESYKKQDDAADVVLFGVYYLGLKYNV